MILLVLGILKKEIQVNLTNRNRPTDIENKYMNTKGERGGKDKLRV